MALEQKEVCRRWRKNNPASVMLRAARCRAKKQGVPCTIELKDIVIPEVCPVLGIKLEVNTGHQKENSPTLDKIVPELGYVKGNVVVISMRANRIKNNASVLELQRVFQFYYGIISEK